MQYVVSSSADNILLGYLGKGGGGTDGDCGRRRSAYCSNETNPAGRDRPPLFPSAEVTRSSSTSSKLFKLHAI